MTQEVLTQILGVSHRRDDRGNEGLVYAPSPLVGEGAAPPDSTWQPMKSTVLQRHIEGVRRRVEELTWQARVGQMRGGLGIEPEADALAQYIFPEPGFVGIIEPGLHPQFDIIFDAASSIPWEVLEDRYAVCRCRQPAVYRTLRGAAATALHCQYCGQRMEQEGGKLVLTRHLTHLVRGGQPPSGVGNEFLIVADPSEDLCSNDPEDVTQQRLAEIHSLLERRGFVVNVLRNKLATSRRFLTMLTSPHLAGIYYFGHGFFPQEGDQGCLVLADGVVYASEIEQANPHARLVFLNACDGAATGRNWTLEKRFRSVGQAFARGGSAKIVVAPLWPVVNLQAAVMAREFFAHAIAGAALGTALREARRKSFQRYQDGQPDVSWMAYRFFGDPNRRFPFVPDQVPIASAGAPAPSSRVFAETGVLKAELFGFDIQDALLRSAKRRNRHGRTQVTVVDFLAGLVRTGNLTRFLLHFLKVDADELYAEIQDAPEPTEELAAAKPAVAARVAEDVSPDKFDPIAQLRCLLSKWIVNQSDEFAPALRALLDRADQASQRRKSASVSEQDVVGAFLDSGGWPEHVSRRLPNAALVRDWLNRRGEEQLVDENGRLILAPLTPMARRIIEASHELAQQRGSRSIPNRLLLASFLNETDSHAAAVCRSQGVDPAAVAALLIAGTDSQSPVSYVLSPEAARRVVLPMIERASVLQTQQRERYITEAILFMAFCEVAPAELKDVLKKLPPPLNMNLDTLRTAARQESNETRPAKRNPATRRAEPHITDHHQGNENGTLSTLRLDAESTQEFLDAPVQQALAMAREFALIQGHGEIRSVHLAVGLIGLRTELILDALRHQSLSPDRLCLTLLRLVPPKAPDDGRTESGLSQRTRLILKRATAIGQSSARACVTERHVWKAILMEPQGIVVQVLRELRLLESFHRLVAHE